MSTRENGLFALLKKEGKKEGNIYVKMAAKFVGVLRKFGYIKKPVNMEVWANDFKKLCLYHNNVQGLLDWHCDCLERKSHKTKAYSPKSFSRNFQYLLVQRSKDAKYVHSQLTKYNLNKECVQLQLMPQNPSAAVVELPEAFLASYENLVKFNEAIHEYLKSGKATRAATLFLKEYLPKHGYDINDAKGTAIRWMKTIISTSYIEGYFLGGTLGARAWRINKVCIQHQLCLFVERFMGRQGLQWWNEFVTTKLA